MNPRAPFAVVCLLLGMSLRAQDVAPAAAAIANTGAQPKLDSNQRVRDYLKAMVSPTAIASNILIAGFEEARNFPHEWGRTGAGFEKRLGSQYAQYFLDNTIELGVSTLLKEDNRYERVGEGGFFRRFGSVVKSTVVVASTTGGHTLAVGQIAGAYGSWAIASQVWEPPSERRGSRILLWGTVNLAAKGGWNLLKEFGPDMSRNHPTSSVIPPSHP